ncbi:sialate O-acetylesterase [Corallibacter sp.]|uniref:sialate O-acetylesterase n=1 Tax=Corallibacter sp. TaxID=2038084 RepID=UPI003A8F6347
MKKYFFYILGLIALNTNANVTLPAIFSDHMVLQQNENVKFWGWATPNEEVTVMPSWTDKVFKVTTNSQAKWEVLVKTPKSGTSYTITVKGYNEIIINDVLIGEVWLCSGQSNMEMSASWGIDNQEQEVANANNPNIRFFRVEKSSSKYPQEHLIGKWEICTPESMLYNSAVAYYFSKKLQDNMQNLPVGLIVSAWGGTPIEIWTPENIILEDAILNEAASKHEVQEWGPIKPGKAYNAMIHPFVGYNLAGVLWYQGEANVGSSVYDRSLSALIQSWRALWQDNFPFYFVQIAPWKYGENHFGGAQVRDSQRNVLNLVKNVDMVVIDDVSTIDEIHPPNKKTVGERLANIALKKHYKKITDLVNGPLYLKVKYIENKAQLYLENNSGLYSKSKTSLFEIAGSDKVYYPAKFKIKDAYVEIFSSKVSSPKYIRYAWKNTAQSNIFNKANIPMSVFTTEEY